VIALRSRLRAALTLAAVCRRRSNKRTCRRPHLPQIIAIASFFLPCAAHAQQDKSDPKEIPVTTTRSSGSTSAETEFRIGIPAWLSGLSGDFGVRGVVADPDITFGDILNNLDMMLAGSIYARYHRWEFSADGLYLRVSKDAQLRGLLFGAAHVALKDAFSEQFIGYRLINCDQGFLSVFAGARWNYESGDFRLLGARLAGRRASGSVDWVDPVIGSSGRVHLWKPLSFWAKGDIGGFGAASDLTWQVQGGLEIQVTRWLYSNIGWRYLKNDYESGGFTNKTELNGPYIETGIRF
jgi:opacity protein-like surface antigen